MTEREARALVDQASKKARWWRNEVDAGRVRASLAIEYLLRDLETCGGIR